MPDLYEQYAEFCQSTAIYPDAGTGNVNELMYLALGLGEAGEVQGKVKKWYRDGKFDPEAVQKEMGDILWYLTNMCTALNTSLPEIMVTNMRKLQSRKERGVLGGSGDER